ncbi:MAG: hypothetical protein M1825_005448 [Sarcosagium campestre]|nr:MAG: hypothetical protein M1825_005448 [Sarcosagium campestre]
MSPTEPVHTDSIDAQESNSSTTKKPKSRRPANTAFRQQRLKAWQPILTPKTVLPLFFAIGIIFAPVGGLLLWASAQVQELVIDYTDCDSVANEGTEPSSFGPIPKDKYTSSFKTKSTQEPTWRRNTEEVEYGGKKVETKVCSLSFYIPNEIGPPVYLYYRLTNFYQNHRRYVKSLDQAQLKGDFISNDTISGGLCNPLRLNGSDFAYYPCGLIANSLFNDTFTSPVLLTLPAKGDSDRNKDKDNNLNQTYAMTNKGIAWEDDKALYGPTKYKWNEVAPPPNWQERYPDGYTEDNPPPNLQEDEAFQVWMRTAGLPSFSKLALRNDNETMGVGTYRVDIQSCKLLSYLFDFSTITLTDVVDFPVTIYGGTKSIVISTTTVMGGKNPFLGIAYIVVGGICVVLGVLFTATHLIKPRKLGDHTYLSWNNDQSASATTTGREMRPGQADA